jgi:hypothetical protein
LQPPNLLSRPAEVLSIEWKLVYPIQTTCYLLKQVTSIQWRGLLFKERQVFKFCHISTIHKVTILQSLVGQKCNLSNELNSAHFCLNRWDIWLRFYCIIHQGRTLHIQSHQIAIYTGLHSNLKICWHAIPDYVHMNWICTNWWKSIPCFTQ